MKNDQKIKPFVLIVLDGFGYREETKYNAIASAHMPNWDAICQHYPHRLIQGSGCDVGLPEGQMGNSEVGHLNLGAGRVVFQEFTRIQHAIENGEFFYNKILIDTLQTVKQTKKKLHIMGLLSPGGVHSHESQIHALIKLAAQQQVEQVFVHAFLDGRDCPPKSAIASIETLEAVCQQYHCGRIASVIGRYYAMDRDQRWDRVEKAYALLTQGKADYHATSAIAAINAAYARNETDEFVQATSIHAEHEQAITITEGDAIIFMNYRADRARQLTRAFIVDDFTGFKRTQIHLSSFVSLTQYATDINTQIAFAAEFPRDTLGEFISQQGLKQLRIAETEKYAHVTFFFNGGVETPYPGEERILIPSPKVATYDLQPEMSAFAITDQLVNAILEEKYALIVCNFANADMVGHSGNFAATVKAVEAIDACLGKIVAAIKQVDGQLIITADHGNAEKMFDETLHQPHTAHTSDPVPLVYIGKAAQFKLMPGALSDVAPTILYLMNFNKPALMTGNNLINL